MTYKIIDKETGREISNEEIEKIAKEGGLLCADIDCFAITEDGNLLLLDDCGNITYCDNKRFKVVYNEIESLKEQIAHVKRNLKSDNSVYLNAYLCALSAVEGIIAEMQSRDDFGDK